MRTGSFAPWRAGGFDGNHFNHSSFIPPNSSSSASTTVTLTILSSELPASSRIAAIFVRHCLVCSWIVVAVTVPVAGLCGDVPETKTRPAAFTAWLYVAGGFGALVVKTIWRVILVPLHSTDSVKGDASFLFSRTHIRCIPCHSITRWLFAQ